MSSSQKSPVGQNSDAAFGEPLAPLLADLSRFFPGRSQEDERRHNQLLDVNSLLTHAPDSHAASGRALEYIAEEVRNGPTQEGERHIRLLCTLVGSVETRHVIAKSHRELDEMLGLYHDTRRQLRHLDVPQRVPAVLARSVVPYLADVCVVDLAVDRDPETLRRVAVETSHLIPDADPIKVALATVDGETHTPHDPCLVVRTGSCRMVCDVSEQDLASASSTRRHFDALRLLAPASYLCVPLRAAGSTVGAMTLLRARSGTVYTHAHRRLAEAIGELYEEPATRAAKVPQATPHANGSSQNGPPQPDSPAPAIHMTRRETEVLRALNEGYNRKTMPQHLGFSTHAYDKTTGELRHKLGAEENLQAVATARALGLLED